MKRILGFLSWHKRRKKVFRADILECLEADLNAQEPDHLMLGGDLTNLGMEQEFIRAKSWIERQKYSETTCLIPGNHEAYGREFELYMERHWKDWIPGGTFPFVRKFGPVAVVGVSSAIRTPPFMAVGRVGEAQCLELRTHLAELGRQGLWRVVMVHHPPQQGACAARRALLDGGTFRSAIAQSGAELILHGHTHHAHEAELQGAEREVPVLGVAAASSGGGNGHLPPAEYLLIDAPENGAFIHWHRRRFQPESSRFETVAEGRRNRGGGNSG